MVSARPGLATAAALALAVIGCGARPRAAPATTTGDEVTLYRDRALVRQRFTVDVPAAGRATVAIKLAAGVAPDDLVILDRGELTVSERRIAHAVADLAPSALRDAAPEPGDDPLDDDDDDDDAPEPAPAPAPAAPTELELVLAAPHAGRFALVLGYTTARLTWDAAYTMTTTAARDRAELRGAIAVRNTTGIALVAHTYVVDAELGAVRDRSAAQLRDTLAGAAEPTPTRDLGVVALGDGETRVAVMAGDPARAMRSALVYDPIGTGLDHPGAAPVADPGIGVTDEVSTRITESFEVDRDAGATRGLPAGPVRLLERRPDDSLVMLGESRLFDAATRVAGVDTIVVGTADGVVGHRVRRGWAKDDDRRRFSEEFLLTIHNARPRPVAVVIREHLYRGQNWTLAYQSAPALKEGPQQISLRTAVPANGHAKVLYVVVYTW